MCGWEPLMEWMRAHDLNPNEIFRFELAHDAPEIHVSAYVLRRTVAFGMVCTTEYTVPLRSFPPDKAADGESMGWVTSFNGDTSTMSSPPRTVTRITPLENRG